MTWILAPIGALADAHPRAVFALAVLFGCAGALSLALGVVLRAARRVSGGDARTEEA